MRVMYVGGFELPDRNAAAHRVTNNVKILTELGCITRLIGVYKNENNKVDEYQVKYPENALEWFLYLIGNRVIFQMIRTFRPGVIIAYNFPALALIRIYIICKIRRIRLIADCTEWYQADGNIFIKFIKQIDIFTRMCLVHPRLDGVIAISRYLYCFYKDRTMTILVPPLVDKSDPKWELTSYTPNEKLKLVYAGKPGTGNKDVLENLISAIKSIRDKKGVEIELDIFGMSNEEYIKSIHHCDNCLMIPANVRFWGRVDHLSTLSAIQSSDFLVFLRAQNRVTEAGFPSKLVESLACGTPVMTNITSNITDYITDGDNCLLLDDSSMDSIVKGLIRAMNLTSNEKLNMKGNCRKLNSFDYNKYIDDFASLMLLR